MAEKIHSQQLAQLKGCFYCPPPSFSLFSAQPNKVAPSYQSTFFSSGARTLTATFIALTMHRLRQNASPFTYSITTIRKSTLVLLRSLFSLFTRAEGLLHFIGYFSFFLIRHNARRTKRALAHNCCHTAIGG